MMKKILILALIFISFMGCAYAGTEYWLVDERGEKIEMPYIGERGLDIDDLSLRVREDDNSLGLLKEGNKITFTFTNASFQDVLPEIKEPPEDELNFEGEFGRYRLERVYSTGVECTNSVSYKLVEQLSGEYDQENLDFVISFKKLKAFSKGDILLSITGDSELKNFLGYAITNEEFVVAKADSKKYDVVEDIPVKFELLASDVEDQIKARGYVSAKGSLYELRFPMEVFNSGEMNDFLTDRGYNLRVYVTEIRDVELENEEYSNPLDKKVLRVSFEKFDRVSNKVVSKLENFPAEYKIIFSDVVTATVFDKDKIYGVEYIPNTNMVYTKEVVAASKYDSSNKQFVIKVDSPGTYTLEQINNLNKISMRINDPLAKNNLNVERLDVSPMIIEGRTYVPIRYIAEKLGATVEFNSANRTVEIKTNSTVIVLPIDKVTPELTTPARIIDGRTLVPVRYVSEQLGAYVTWFAETQKIEILKIG